MRISLLHLSIRLTLSLTTAPTFHMQLSIQCDSRQWWISYLVGFSNNILGIISNVFVNIYTGQYPFLFYPVVPAWGTASISVRNVAFWHDHFICDHLPEKWGSIIHLLVRLKISMNMVTVRGLCMFIWVCVEPIRKYLLPGNSGIW